MIILYLFAVGIGVAAYMLAARFTMGTRLGIALAVFLLFTLPATLWVLAKGDKAPSDATTVVPKNP